MPHDNGEVRIHWVKGYGEGEVYYTIVFKEKSITICKLAEKIVSRKKKFRGRIDDVIIKALIQRQDYGVCEEIMYDKITEINKSVANNRLCLMIKLKNGNTLFFYIDPRKKMLLKRGLRLFKKYIDLKQRNS